MGNPSQFFHSSAGWCCPAGSGDHSNRFGYSPRARSLAHSWAWGDAGTLVAEVLRLGHGALRNGRWRRAGQVRLGDPPGSPPPTWPAHCRGLACAGPPRASADRVAAWRGPGSCPSSWPVFWGTGKRNRLDEIGGLLMSRDRSGGWSAILVWLWLVVEDWGKVC